MNFFLPPVNPIAPEDIHDLSRQQEYGMPFGQPFGQQYGQPYGGYYPPRPPRPRPRCRWVRECRWVRRCSPYGYGYGDSQYDNDFY
nr:hypothetical protein [Fredinandcohnia onubensis]